MTTTTTTTMQQKAAMSCERCDARLERGDLRCAVCALAVPVDDAVVETESLKVFRCNGCGAATSWSAEKKALACAFCGGGVALEEIEDPMEQTDRWVPFAVDAAKAKAALTKWQRSLGFFRPSDLAKMSTVDALKPLWWPAWIFDARARATWAADSDAGSGRSSWAPHAGDAELSFERLLVGASRGLSHDEMNGLADAYDIGPALPERAGGYGSRAPDDVVEETFDTQRSAAREKVAAACHAVAQERIEKGHIPGHRFRNVHVSLVLSDLITRRVALPAWILAYKYKGTLYRVVVHGQSDARVLGKAPWSLWKIAGAVAAGLAVLAIVATIVVVTQRPHRTSPRATPAPAALHR